jgi:hypothetical protein
MVRVRISNGNETKEVEINDALAVCGDYVVFPAFKEKDACVMIDSDGDLTLIYDDEKIDFDLNDYGIFIHNEKWERISNIHDNYVNNYVIETGSFRIKYKWYGLTLVIKVTPIANTCQ